MAHGPSPLVCVLALSLAHGADDGCVRGAVEYTSKGPRLDGKPIPWEKFRVLEETPPDRPAPAADEEARALFAEKRRAAGTQAQLLDLADWCNQHALWEEEWKILSSVAVAAPRDRGLLKRMMGRLEREGRRAETIFRPPFEGRWKAMPDVTKHHQSKVWAIYAIDFMKVNDDDRVAPKGKGKDLPDFYCFAEPVLAAADGIVEMVENGYPDLPPGKTGDRDEANRVLIRHENGERSEYGHLKKGTVCVKVGGSVKKGEMIGRVGNSGRSGIPHLHFHVIVPIYDEAGKGLWVSIPYFFEGFVLSTVDGKGAGIRVRRARPQEGWVLECPPVPQTEEAQEKTGW